LAAPVELSLHCTPAARRVKCKWAASGWLRIPVSHQTPRNITEHPWADAVEGTTPSLRSANVPSSRGVGRPKCCHSNAQARGLPQRNEAASSTCVTSTGSEPSKSAIVLATLAMRSVARVE